MSQIELVAAIAEKNQSSPNLKGIRIKDGTMMATNMSETIKVSQLPFDSLNCFVNSKDFIDAYKVTRVPTMIQTEDVLAISEGKFNAKLMLLNNDDFPFTDREPEGDDVDPRDFSDAVAAIAPFLKMSVVPLQAFAVGKNLYATNGTLLVRVPMETEFTETVRPITVSSSLADMMAKQKKAPISLKIGKDTLTVIYDDCWIESARYANELPGDFVANFKAMDNVKTEVLPDEVVPLLKEMCNAAVDKTDQVVFSPMGITFNQGGRSVWTISHTTKPLRIQAKQLKEISAQANEFNFDSPKRLVFRGPKVFGLISCAPVTEVK